MRSHHDKGTGRRLVLLRKRCPWVASLLLHCLESRDPRAVCAMKLMLMRLRLKAA